MYLGTRMDRTNEFDDSIDVGRRTRKLPIGRDDKTVSTASLNEKLNRKFHRNPTSSYVITTLLHFHAAMEHLHRERSMLMVMEKDVQKN